MSGKHFRRRPRPIGTSSVRPHSSQKVRVPGTQEWRVHGNTPETVNRSRLLGPPRPRKKVGLYFEYKLKFFPSFSVSQSLRV